MCSQWWGGEKTRQALVMITDTAYIIGAGEKEDSPAEMGERRKQQQYLHYNDGIEDVVFATHSPVMFHVFTVVRRENTAGISDDHRHCIHHWDKCMQKRGTHALRWKKGENSINHNYITTMA